MSHRVLCLQGANQGRRAGASAELNRKVWLDGIAAERDNAERFHAVAPVSSLSFPWYGDVFSSMQPLGPPLREKDSDIVRKAMDEAFDELVPFYELATCRGGAAMEGRDQTLYQVICGRVLNELELAVAEDIEKVSLIGHSMGAQVSYHVLHHISADRRGEAFCERYPQTLSQSYRSRIRSLNERGLEFEALLTFGNPAAYDWSQKCGADILFGEPKCEFRYPDAVSRWRNFWTVGGADPFIADDCLGVEDDRFEDVEVWTVPFWGLGHSIADWFSRDDFVKKLCRNLVE